MCYCFDIVGNNHIVQKNGESNIVYKHYYSVVANLVDTVIVSIKQDNQN